MGKINSESNEKSKFREYIEAFLTAVLVAFVLRAFVVEAFKIPSKSMVPTLMVGDHIFVNKFIYGLRVPFSKKWLTHFKTPQRGEVIVFIYPLNEKLDFIKRVVGLPGDSIKVSGDDVYINGEKVSYQPITVVGQNPKDKRELLLQPPAELKNGEEYKEMPYFPEYGDYSFFIEKLGNTAHLKQEAGFQIREGVDVKVPEGKLFVMGDNRDNSSDSREWGFVPLENVKGKAMFIWLSLDHDQGGVRWDRFGKWIE